MFNTEQIIVALDVDKKERAVQLVDELSPFKVTFKIGLEMISAGIATELIDITGKKGGKVFYDGKLNDIPNTVGRAAKAVSALGVKMFNVHASSGIEAMMAAVANKGDSLVLAVTVLTSLEENNAHLDFGSPTKAKVLQFARDALIAGCDGIVCSPQELEFLSKQKELKNLKRVTPGVRPLWAAVGDQKRVMTPAEAIKLGADYLVIGRPITNPPGASTPAMALQKIIEEIIA